MAATHYMGSRGLMAIDEMPFPYLLNARDKLVREGDPARQPEVEAMSARLKVLDAEHAAAEAAKPEPERTDDIEATLASADLEGF